MKRADIVKLATFFWLVTAALATTSAWAQDWSGALKGILQGKPPPAGNVVGILKSITDVSTGQVSDGSAKPAEAETSVLLYRTSWCGYCKRAATYMRDNSIAFVERDIEANPSYNAEYKRLGGKGGVPFIVIGNKTMAGFSEAQFRRDYAEFQQQGSGKATVPEAPGSAAAGAMGSLPKPGDTLTGKIGGIEVRTQPIRASPPLVMLGKADEVVFMGEEQNGFYRVTTSKGEGWVDKLLVRKP